MNVATIAALTLSALTIGCERGTEQRTLETPPTVYGDENLVQPRPVIVTGCLTASGERFVLTKLDGGAAGPRVVQREGERPWAEEEPTTETYRLVGMQAKLQDLVGQRVEITGEVEPEMVVDTREFSASVEAPTGEGGGTSAQEPRVSAVQTTRIEIRDLHIRSVTSTGEQCLEAQ